MQPLKNFMITLAARINHARVFSQFHLTFNWLSRNHLLPTRLTAFQTTRGMLSWESEVCLDYFFLTWQGTLISHLTRGSGNAENFGKLKTLRKYRGVCFIDFNTLPPSRFTIRRNKDKSFINTHTHTLTIVNSFSFFFQLSSWY